MSDCSATENTDESLLSPSIPNPILPQTSEIRRRPHGNTKQSNQFALTNEVLLTVKDHFKQPQIREDRFDIFRKNVAMKLRDLSTPQRVMAEKLINDVLFEGEMENLSTSHKLSYGSNSQSFRMNPLHYPQSMGYGSASSSTSSFSAQSPLHQHYLPTPQFQTQFPEKSFLPLSNNPQSEITARNAKDKVSSFLSSFTNNDNIV